MGPAGGPVDALSRAIAELREELISWIDTESARLQAGEQGEDHTVQGTSGALHSTRSGPKVARAPVAPSSRDETRPGTLDDARGTDGEAYRSRQSFGERALNADVAEPPVAVRGLKPEPETQAAPLDAGQRLDALAQLLNRRLKQVDGAAGAANSMGECGGKGTLDTSGDRERIRGAR
jgi:hypothetical protein